MTNQFGKRIFKRICLMIGLWVFFCTPFSRVMAQNQACGTPQKGHYLSIIIGKKMVLIAASSSESHPAGHQDAEVDFETKLQAFQLGCFLLGGQSSPETEPSSPCAVTTEMEEEFLGVKTTYKVFLHEVAQEWRCEYQLPNVCGLDQSA